MNSLIVVTGGSGFIGSVLVGHLNDLGYKNIVVVDDFDKSEKWKNLVGKHFVEVLHKDQLFSYCEGKHVEAIFHLGACSDTTELDSYFLIENNYRYSCKLAEYAIKHQIRFIYASSAATYGDGALGFSDSHDLLESLKPLNMYGYSKHLFDLWLKRKHLLDKVVGLKYFNVYGPNEYHKGRMASAILKMVPDALTKGKICLFQSSEPQLFEDGGQKRDFIYVKDVARITAQFLKNNVCGIFNLGTGIPRTWNDLARAVISAVDRPVSIEYISMPQDLIGKYQNYTCAEMSKCHDLKFGNEYTLESGVQDYLRNYLLKGLYL